MTRRCLALSAFCASRLHQCSGRRVPLINGLAVVLLHPLSMIDPASVLGRFGEGEGHLESVRRLPRLVALQRRIRCLVPTPWGFSRRHVAGMERVCSRTIPAAECTLTALEGGSRGILRPGMPSSGWRNSMQAWYLLISARHPMKWKINKACEAVTWENDNTMGQRCQFEGLGGIERIDANCGWGDAFENCEGCFSLSVYINQVCRRAPMLNALSRRVTNSKRDTLLRKLRGNKLCFRLRYPEGRMIKSGVRGTCRQ